MGEAGDRHVIVDCACCVGYEKDGEYGHCEGREGSGEIGRTEGVELLVGLARHLALV